MLAKSNKPSRVLTTSSLRATRRSRFIIILFIITVIFLMLSILFKVWPLVKITIKPEVISLSSQLNLKVDLDSNSPLVATSSIPGRIKELGEDDNQLMEKNYLIRSIKGASIVFSENDILYIASQSLTKLAPPESVLLTNTLSINEGDWSVSDTGRVFYGSLMLKINYYQPLPLADWREEIIGVDKDKAINILSQKTGVSSVRIDTYPLFLANISKKLPNSKDDIRLTLDIN